MDNPETRRRALETVEKRRTPKSETRSRDWMNAGIVILAVIVLALGYALVRRVFIAPPIDAAVERVDGGNRREGKIQVNVVNASGGQRAARRAMDFLRARGFDVVEIGTTSPAIAQSLVIDRVNDSSSAHKVAFALGVADSCVRREENRKLFLDVTVLLGQDFELLKPFR